MGGLTKGTTETAEDRRVEKELLTAILKENRLHTVLLNIIAGQTLTTDDLEDE